MTHTIDFWLLTEKVAFVRIIKRFDRIPEMGRVSHFIWVTLVMSFSPLVKFTSFISTSNIAHTIWVTIYYSYLNDSFSEKLFQFMLAKPVSKWEMPVGNFTVWNTVSAQTVPWALILSPPPMTHSQPFSHQQAQDVTFQEPSLLIWNHLLSIQVFYFPVDRHGPHMTHGTIEQFLTILFSTIWIV